MSKGMVNRVDARLFQTAHFYICENVFKIQTDVQRVHFLSLGI